VETYYAAVNHSKPVASFYVNSNATYSAAGQLPADICINGEVLATPEEWDRRLQQQRQIQGVSATGQRTVPVRYTVETCDIHILNRDYRFAAPPAMLVPDTRKPDLGASRRMMAMLTVSGFVKLGDDGDSVKQQHFNDVFILVPNWDVFGKHGSRKRYLITSHNYRAFGET